MKNCPICKSPVHRSERILNGYPLRKCGQCSFVFADLDKELIEKVNSRHDDQFIDNFEACCQSPFEVAFFRQLAARFHASSGPGRVLDVGCGTGLLLSFFKELGWECVGVDLSSWTERYAKKYGFTFHQGRLEALDLPEKSFDLVVSTSTLEHIEAPLPHVSEILRLVKPGGQVYLSGVPNYRSLSVLLGFSRFVNNMPPDHPNYFTPQTLRGLLLTAGVAEARLKVKSYGLAGAHQAYFALKKGWKKTQSAVAEQTADSHRQDNADGAVVGNRLIRLLAVNFYLLAGRPFGLGSKLEARVKVAESVERL